MWIKTSFAIFNPETRSVIKLYDLSEKCNEVLLNGVPVESFRTRQEAEEYLNKLAEKLEAENVDKDL